MLTEQLIAASIKGIPVLIAAAALCFALRRASAAARHFVWTVAMCGLLALPLLSVALPAWQIPVLPAASEFGSTSTEDAAVVAEPGKVNFIPAPLEQINIPDRTSTISNVEPANIAPTTDSNRKESNPYGWIRWALMLWLAGALLVVSRVMIGVASVWWIAYRARRVTDLTWLSAVTEIANSIGLTRRVRIFTTANITMPMTSGVFRSAILLPESSYDWSVERRQVVLVHELSHVKRWDCLTQLLAQIACAIYWFNPLVWMAARELRIERERACDDQVIDLGTKASEYAAHLLEMARSFRSNRYSSLATVAIARRSELEGRLLAILEPGLKRRALNRVAAISVGAAIVCLVFPLATLQLSARAQANKQQPEFSLRVPDLRTVSPVPARPDSTISESRSQQTDRVAEHSTPPDVAEAEQKTPVASTPTQQADNNATIEALRGALKDEDPEVRRHAVFALTQIEGPAATTALIEALKDEVWQVRARAASALGMAGGRNSVEPLVGALRDNSWQVREQAAWALGLRGDRRAVEPLIAALSDEAADVREKSAWSLGLKGDSRAVDPLITSLKDSNARVRDMAAWALGLKGDSRAGTALKDALKDPDTRVRQKAAWALGMLLLKRGGAPVGLPDPDNEVEDDVDGRVRGSVSGGIAGGVAGGISGGVAGGVTRGGGSGVSGGVAGGAGGGTGGGVGRGVDGGVSGGVAGGVGSGGGEGTGSGAGVGPSGGVSGGLRGRLRTRNDVHTNQHKAKSKPKEN